MKDKLVPQYKGQCPEGYKPSILYPGMCEPDENYNTRGGGCKHDWTDSKYWDFGDAEKVNEEDKQNQGD